MGQLALFFALQLLGSWACVAVGPRREPGLALAMGFAIGLAIAVFLALPLLLLGVFTVPVVVGVLGAALAAAIAGAVRRGRATPRLALGMLGWAAAFTALCLPFCLWNVAKLTYDSQVFVEYAQALRDDHELRLETLGYLHSWGSFLIVAHALSLLTGDPFLYALAPAFTISLFATLALALHRGLAELAVPPRRRAVAIALTVLVLLAIPLVRLHAIYVHANWPAGGYLFVFGALAWLAEVRRDPAYLPAAFLGLLAFCFARVESTMFAVPILVLVLSQTQLPRGAVLRAYLPFTVVLVAWLALMTSVIPSDSDYMTPARSLLMLAAVALVCAGFLVREHRLLRPLLPSVPPLVAIGGVLVVAVLAVVQHDVFRVSFAIWQRGLWLGSFWGYFAWPLFALLAVGSLRVAAPPASRALRYSLGMFLVLVGLLACLGDEYGAGRYGSLTRVTLQIVPSLAFYFALVVAPLTRRRGT